MTKLPGLEDEEEKGSSYGPVYQGTARQIRRLTASGSFKGETQIIDPDMWAGTIAQARSLAASIDRASGHGGRPQANGVPLAQMHMQLAALLAELNPEASTEEADPLTLALEEFRRNEEAQRGRATAPHPEV
ncbi:hypothetical protein ACOCJ5_10330 [Knoellia sp. CPCC 206450]|uniref:hypothetical protein n=1 Tax=Knoellia tibetensis TaxID=3404798 RepID=UPI003B43A613